ncbi:ribonuclease P protein component [Arboricoccus pini]|uniref:ribonuclease P protein component n=1 Tax=Arboricoccus pini TaxID=1963835 RepID=UPI0013FDB0F5|nr:ribonuclease P protein component [Arboricoccus pini]
MDVPSTLTHGPVRTTVLRLKRRPDFLSAARGQRWNAQAFQLQAVRRASAIADANAARIGFTTTKRLGNAVCRNRIRRRLKAASAEVAEGVALAGYDYVFVARPPALICAFADLKADMERAFAGLTRRLRRDVPG